METAMIPVVDTPRLQGLVTTKRNMSHESLLQMGDAQRVALKRVWFDEAQAANFPAWLVLTVRTFAPVDGIWSFSWNNQRQVEVVWIHHNDRLRVKVNGKEVCSTETPGEEWLIPGDWVHDCFAEAERRHRMTRRNAEHEQMRVRLAEIETLTSAV